MAGGGLLRQLRVRARDRDKAGRVPGPFVGTDGQDRPVFVSCHTHRTIGPLEVHPTISLPTHIIHLHH